jgi:RloB-like protein
VREPYDVVLIVCEGAKTEPNYFRGLRNAYGLSNVNVRILMPDGNDPLSIVTFAIAELEHDKEYDRAYCVFDRDGHATYDAALRRIRESELGKAGRLIGITSIPCFEIWVLLHYQYSAASYVAAGRESACGRLIRDVQRYYPAYAKGHETVFAELAPRMHHAIKHAVRLEKHNDDTCALNPATQMHHMVNYLTKLKR